MNKLKKQVSIFGAGLLISFAGSLPPGLLNIVAVQLTDKRGINAAFQYAAGATLAEMLVVWFALTCINWFSNKKNLFALLEWLTVSVLLLFAAACFVAAYLMEDIGRVIPPFLFSSILTGFLFSLLNPVHIPFWIGWSNFLSGRGTLEQDRIQYIWYISGIGAGTLSGFLIYILGGPYLLQLIQHRSAVINSLSGIILLTAAGLQMRRMLKVPLPLRYAETIKKKEDITSPF